MKKVGFLLLNLIVVMLSAQTKTEQYIEQYSQIAVEEMNRYNIPASITLAQGILESGNGESRLATEGKNHFGIKCHDNWNGKTIIEDDDEKGECFRKYSKAADSYRDHSLFLTERGRYSFLFKYSKTAYKKWAKGLKKAGYATNPKYPTLLIDLIEKYDLSRFDKGEERVKNLFVAHSYGFPFLYGVGLNYIKTDKYFIAVELNSSFIFSGVAVRGGLHLFDKMYGSLSVNGIYSMFAKDETQRFDFAVSPQLNYVLDTKNKRILISAGVLFPFKDIIKKKMIPTVSLTYLLL
jgi:hypothetical protein